MIKAKLCGIPQT